MSFKKFEKLRQIVDFRNFKDFKKLEIFTNFKGSPILVKI